MANRRKNLLVVRVGDRSLHRHWLDTSDERNFDVHVSYFGSRSLSEVTENQDVTASAEKGPKFIGLLECLQKIESTLDYYDYIGFPDDDLYATGDTWNSFFAIVASARPRLAQPALHRSSFYTFHELLQVPRFRLRWTNFVEAMTPVFSKSALKQALPYFSENNSGWGMDHLWPKLFDAERRQMIVVDDTPVLHTRAVRSGPLYNLLGKLGDSPYAELDAFLRKHGLQEEPFKVFAALNKNGRLIDHAQSLPKNIVPRARSKIRKYLSVTEISGENWLHML